MYRQARIHRHGFQHGPRLAGEQFRRGPRSEREGSQGIGAQKSRQNAAQPLFRQWMGKTFNFMIRALVAGGIHDTQCGFKLLDGPTARAVFANLLLDGFAYDVELLWLARQRGLRVAEVGVEWNHSPDSKVHLFTDSARMALDILRIRLLHRFRPRRKP